MTELPPDDLSPDKAEAMLKRACRQLGEHFLGVTIVAIRQEDRGASGVYHQTAGNSHAAEKGVEDFVDRARIRRRVRYELEARGEDFTDL